MKPQWDFDGSQHEGVQEGIWTSWTPMGPSNFYVELFSKTLWARLAQIGFENILC